ncbi:MAG TPA: hypothetical protein VGC89_10390 [Pyrinomonadaceae bacterium]
MDTQRRISSERAVARLWQIAVGLVALAIFPLGVGLRLRNGTHILIGAYALGLALFIMLVATIIWAVAWLKKNVRIK